MKFSTKACIVAAIAAAFTFAGPSAYATQKGDPCSGQHVPVYNQGDNINHHYVCGAPGTQGPKGDPGKDSTVPGPAGAQGPAGPKGDNGADSTVPGPAGKDGQDGQDGVDSVVPGPQGIPGTPGTPGAKGDPGRDGEDGVDSYCSDAGAASEASGGSGDAGANSELAVGSDSGSSVARDCTGPAGAPGKPGADGDDGAPGAPGRDGVAGADGKDGVTKTVYITRVINEDGTVTDTKVDSLPKTGGDNWILIPIALGLIGLGIAAVYYFRNRP